MSETTDLYRYFDVEGRLLYVGISLSAVARATQHRDRASWWEMFDKMTRETFPTRAAAMEAERDAIRSERPLFNVVHNRDRDVIPAAAPRSSGKLVGKFVHTFENGVLHFQGVIEEQVASDLYLVQWFSFADGMDSHCSIVELGDMKEWQFYGSSDEMREAYDEYDRMRSIEVQRHLSGWKATA